LTEVFFFIIKVQNAFTNLQQRIRGGLGGLFKGGGLIGKLGFPSFAQGGIVPGPTGAARLAVVHGGESITPRGGMGRNVTINVTGMFLSEEAAEQMGDLLLEKLKTQIRF